MYINITLGNKISRSPSFLREFVLSVSSDLSYLQPPGLVLSNTVRGQSWLWSCLSLGCFNGTLAFFKDVVQRKRMVTYNCELNVFISISASNGDAHRSWLTGICTGLSLR